MDHLDAMHKFFLVARQKKLCSPHTLDLGDLSRCPTEPQVQSAPDMARVFIYLLKNLFTYTHITPLRFLTLVAALGFGLLM